MPAVAITIEPAPASPAPPELEFAMSTPHAASNRIASLDQFRGYTVAGMFLVNFLGGYWACPSILRHHNTFCSYADTIMPHFLFAVGFAFRLTFGRRVQAHGSFMAYLRVIRRLLGLVLVALVVYTVGRPADTWSELTNMGFWDVIAEPLKRTWFQTLMHIAATSLWIVPVIRARPAVRVGYLLFSAALHVYVSYRFYFDWTFEPPNAIDGGPLGFLTWSIPALAGTLACDAIVNDAGQVRLQSVVFWGIALMLLGYVFSCGTRLYDVPAGEQQAESETKLAQSPVWPSFAGIRNRDLKSLLAEPPFVPPPMSTGAKERERVDWRNLTFRSVFIESPDRPPPDESYKVRKWNYWMMSQRAGTLSYLTFSAGFSLIVYALFVIVCDRWNLQLGLFRTFGTNALAGYVLHMMINSAVSPFIPKDAPGWYMTAGFLAFFGITYLFVRTLEKNNIFIKL